MYRRTFLASTAAALAAPAIARGATASVLKFVPQADLAVLDRDPFAGEPEQIASTRVLATYIDGRAVYTDPAL